MRRLLAISALGLTMVIATVVVAVFLPGAPDVGSFIGFVATVFGGLWLYWGVGALIVVRADGHVVGWLFAIAAVLMASVFGCYAVGWVLASSQPPDPLGAWFWLYGSLLFPPAIILLLPAVAIMFPTGGLPGPRWRWPVGLVVAMVAVRTPAVLIRPGPMGDVGPDNPLTPWLPAASPSVLEILSGLEAIGSLSILLGAGVGVAAISVRFRRSRGDQREQLKWFLAAITLAAILLPISLSDVVNSFPLVSLLSVATLPIVAVSVAIAILRYRLYDIDRIISRTVSYGAVTGILAIVFVGTILVSQTVLASFFSGNSVAVAASTLIVAALFQPLRRRVQSVVDRRFDRSRYDAQLAAEAFAIRLRDQVDLDRIEQDLAATVEGSLRPLTVGLWVRDVTPGIGG